MRNDKTTPLCLFEFGGLPLHCKTVKLQHPDLSGAHEPARIPHCAAGFREKPLQLSGRNICLPVSVYKPGDRKSTRLNSSHQIISYAVFCLKKKKQDPVVRADRVEARQQTAAARQMHVSPETTSMLKP